MKPSIGSAYLDDINSIYHNTLYSFHIVNRGHYLKRFVIDIRASKNISGLIKVTVTSPAGLMKFFLNVEHWLRLTVFIYSFLSIYCFDI